MSACKGESMLLCKRSHPRVGIRFRGASFPGEFEISRLSLDPLTFRSLLNLLYNRTGFLVRSKLFLMDQTTESEGQERMVEVINKMGIHARPAAMIVRVANKYDAEVYVERDGELVNGKSIMGLMMLAAGQGSKLKFIANGSGAEQLLDEMDALFKSQFNEG